MSTFPERLRALRKERKIKQAVIAAYVGVIPRAIRFYESGDREPNIAGIIKLADFFDVSTDYLLGRSDDPRRH